MEPLFEKRLHRAGRQVRGPRLAAYAGLVRAGVSNPNRGFRHLLSQADADRPPSGGQRRPLMWNLASVVFGRPFGSFSSAVAETDTPWRRLARVATLAPSLKASVVRLPGRSE